MKNGPLAKRQDEGLVNTFDSGISHFQFVCRAYPSIKQPNPQRVMAGLLELVETWCGRYPQ